MCVPVSLTKTTNVKQMCKFRCKATAAKGVKGLCIIYVGGGDSIRREVHSIRRDVHFICWGAFYLSGGAFYT